MNIQNKVFTVCYLWRIIPGESRVQILLGRHRDTPGARKLRMVNLWNGFGGKMDPDQDSSLHFCAQRETREECGVIPSISRLRRAGRIKFDNTGSIAIVHFFFADLWTGIIRKETDEMYDNSWHYLDDLPYDSMMEADRKFKLPYSCITAHS
jgi:8-oxo-dGTP pyrophosphatase MutT (NUDIX family)